MTEDVSRRKMLSLLGFGAALGFTLSAAVEPLEAEAQTVAQAAPATPATPARPPEHTECNGGKDDAPIAVSGALVAMSDGTRAAPVSLRPPPQLRPNRGDPRPALTSARFGHQTKRTREAWALLVLEFVDKQRISFRVPAIRGGPLSAFVLALLGQKP